MTDNSISKISEMILNNDISELIKDRGSILEINSAINEVEEVLKKEELREDMIKKELKKEKNNSSKYAFDLDEYLSKIEKNIITLKNFSDILHTKKRLVEFETEKTHHYI